MSNTDNLTQRLRRAINHALTFSDDVLDDRAVPFDDLVMRDRALAAFDAELRLQEPRQTMTTNEPTPVILSDEALAEIEAAHTQGACRFHSNRRSVLALCQAVRALREMVYLPKILPDDNEVTFQEEGARLLRQNTALREQLAHLQSQTHFLTCGARIEALESRLAQVEKERERRLVDVLEQFRSKNIRRIDLIAALAKADLLHAEEQP